MKSEGTPVGEEGIINGPDLIVTTLVPHQENWP
jgi:hypothetical protein